MRYGLMEFRKDKGLTIREMAEKLDISQSFYEKVEYGERNPSYNFIMSFKKAFPLINIDTVLLNVEGE